MPRAIAGRRGRPTAGGSRSTRIASGIYQLWTIRPDGSGLEQIADVPGTNFPVWSPDGARIAFSGVTAGGFYIVDSAGKAAKPAGPEPAMSANDRSGRFARPEGASLAGISRPARRLSIGHLAVYTI